MGENLPNLATLAFRPNSSFGLHKFSMQLLFVDFFSL
jgi:hypothetical protein